MKTKTRRGVAALAATAMAAVLLPFVAAGVASAQEPNAIAVTPSTGYAALGATATFAVTGVGASAIPLHNMYYIITSGPDAAADLSVPGQSCNAGGGVPASSTETCSVTSSHGAGTDLITFYYDGKGTGIYSTTDPSAAGSLVIGDTTNPASATITAASAHVGLGGYTKYTVAVVDAASRPDTGVSVTLTANLPATPASSSTPAVAGNYDVVDGATHAQPTGQYMTIAGSGSNSSITVAGVATFYVATDYLADYSLAATIALTPSIHTTTAVAVDSATADDATSVVTLPATQKAFNNTTSGATVNVTVTNAQGDPVAGVFPEFSVAGVNPAANAAGATQTDANGKAAITYTTGSAVGTDTVTVWVNKTSGAHQTVGLDSNEASAIATLNVVTNNFTTSVTHPATVSVPVSVTHAPVAFHFSTSDGSSPAGYTVHFVVSNSDYSLQSATGITDSSGNVTATVIDAAPNANGTDTVNVTASLTSSIMGTSTINWLNQAAVNPVIAPFANTKPLGGSTTHTASLTDSLGHSLDSDNISYSWNVTGRNTATGTSSGAGGFSYTDTSTSATGSSDTIVVTAKNSAGGIIGTDTVTQYWITGTAKAAQAAIDVGSVGSFSTSAPYTPSGFAATLATGVTADPTSSNVTATNIPVVVRVVDANGDPLFGKAVTFTSSGVGGFTDSNGVPTGSSTTALITDGNTHSQGELQGQVIGSGVGAGVAKDATVYVRSTSVGTQTIVATVDGITNTATVTYTGQYVSLSSPQRVLDTRSGQGGLSTTNGAGAVLSGGKLSPNTAYNFSFNSTNIPLDNASYAFNVTAISPSGPGNLRVVNECDDPNGIPTSSLINYQAGKDVANFSVISNAPISGPGHCDELRIYSDQASVAVAIDLVGYYPQAASVTGIASDRLVDTRTGLGGGTGKLLAGTSRSFQIADGGVIPFTATAVALNVTAIDPQGLGNLRVYADGAAVPNASNINYIKGVDKAAFVIVQLPANGKIDVYSDQVAVDVAIDAYAYFPSTGNTVTITPTRVLDTRTTGGTLAANTVRNVTVGGVNGIPANAQAVLVSITSIHAASSTGFGNLRVYGAGAAFPNASNLNYVSKSADVANFAIVTLGAGGQLSLYSSVSPIDVALDVVGYVPAGS